MTRTHDAADGRALIRRAQRIAREDREESTADGAVGVDRTSTGVAGAVTRTNVCFHRTSYDSLGGGPKMLLRLLRSLDREAFDVRLLSQYEDELCDRAAEIDGVTVEIVPYRGALDRYDEALLRQSPLEVPRTALRLVQYDLEARSSLRWADVLWCDCLRSLLTVGPYAVLSRTPTIWNVGLGSNSEGVRRYLNDVGLAIADRVFIESREQARTVFAEDQLRRHEDAFTVFHKGIDVDRFAPADVDDDERDAFRIGVAARITPRKGIEHLIEAIATVRDAAKVSGGIGADEVAGERHVDELTGEPQADGSGGGSEPGELGGERRADGQASDCEQVERARAREVELVVAGEAVDESDRAYRAELDELVAKHGLEDVVTFCGWVDEMPEFYRSLDAFVLPSLDEGIPGAVREAQATALPVVATDVGGTSDVVHHGETGLLVEPERPDEIAAALLHLLEHPEHARQMGRAGRQLICESFSLDAYVEQYESFLAEVAGR